MSVQKHEMAVIEPGSVSEWVWQNKYRFPHDKTPADTARRVARELASCEKDPAMWEAEFYDVLSTFEFLPAGRIIAGAGTGRAVTYSNCFVMGTIDDSLAGIMKAVGDAAMTMKAGGGVGMDFSTLRPRGAIVKGVDSVSSGAVSFMDLWNTMCGTIMSAGARRGAMMGTLRCDHPDIEEFITAKRTSGRLTNFNVSVLVTDAFMDAVKHNRQWALHFGGVEYRTLKARDLWEQIARLTYEHAEPGVIFIDRINATNPLNKFETISATNPCVSGDTLILTRDGNVPISTMVGRQVEVWNGYEWSEVEPRITGHDQDLLRITFSNGLTLDCTPSHRFVLADRSRVEARDLIVGAPLVKSLRPIIGEYDENDHPDAWQQGFFSGDGHSRTSDGKCYVFLYGEKIALADAFSSKWVTHYEGRSVVRLGAMRSKSFVPNERWSIRARLEWFAGLCDSDGTALADVNSKSIQVSSVDRQFLVETAMMLQGLGVQPSIALMHEAKQRMLPDGRGGHAEYQCVDCYRMVLKATDVKRLQNIGFATKRLDLTGNNPQRDAARFVRVASIQRLPGKHTVYCFTEPKNHTGVFNGITTSNCGEQPLPPYGACLLGSINLTQFVRQPFSKKSWFDSGRLAEVVRTAVRMMDNVNDVSAYPLPQQHEEAQRKRRIGLGVTGLADVLIMMGLRYGSREAVETTSNVMSEISTLAEMASEALGLEKGNFPLFDPDRFPGSPIARRNSHLTSIAPTGTISLLAGNISSGIEPVFAFGYTRRLLQPDGSHKEVRVEDYVVRLAKAMGVPTTGPEWVTTDDLTVDDHLAMVAAIQPWVDSSISKTINCPADMPFDEFAAVYTKAYELGLKGCTTYRPSGTRGAVLVKDTPAPTVEPVADSNVVQIGEPLARDEMLRGRTYKIPPGGGLEHGIYVTINDIVQHGRRRPFEIFVNTKAVDSYSWIIALTRMVSAVWRKGGDVAFVAEELKQVFDPRGGFWVQGKQVASVCAAIGQIIERHMLETGHLSEAEAPAPVARVLHCPKCQTGALHAAEGCMSCDSCDYSKCG